jgi:hypothetical protein
MWVAFQQTQKCLYDSQIVATVKVITELMLIQTEQNVMSGSH